jgi:dihydroorotase
MERKIARDQPGDLTIISLDHSWTYKVKESASKSRNSPFDARTFKGGAAATIVAGKIIYKR